MGLLGPQQKYHPIVGQDDLDKNKIEAILPPAIEDQNQYMEAEFAADLRNWLIEPDFIDFSWVRRWRYPVSRFDVPVTLNSPRSSQKNIVLIKN